MYVRLTFDGIGVWEYDFRDFKSANISAYSDAALSTGGNLVGADECADECDLHVNDGVPRFMLFESESLSYESSYPNYPVSNSMSLPPMAKRSSFESASSFSSPQADTFSLAWRPEVTSHLSNLNLLSTPATSDPFLEDKFNYSHSPAQIHHALPMVDSTGIPVTGSYSKFNTANNSDVPTQFQHPFDSQGPTEQGKKRKNTNMVRASSASTIITGRPAEVIIQIGVTPFSQRALQNARAIRSKRVRIEPSIQRQIHK